MNLAELVGGTDPKADVRLRQAKVVGTPANGIATIQLGGSTDSIGGVRHLAGAALADGESVWALQQGGALLILGRVGAPISGGGAGDVTFAGNVTINGWVKAKNSAPGTITTIYTGGGGAVDIAGWLDFHGGRNADEATPNYDIRLENVSAAGILQVLGGRFRCGLAEMGTHPVHFTYAWFGHKDMTGSTQYGFLQNTAETLMNAVTACYICRNGVTSSNAIRLDASGVYVSDDIAIPSDRAIYFKGPWDATHIIHHWGSSDGFIYRTWTEHRFETQNVRRATINDSGIYCHTGWFRAHGSEGIYFQDRGHGWNSTSWLLMMNYGEGVLRLRKNVWMSAGNWGYMPCSESAGNQDVGFAWHMPGWRAAAMWLGTDNIFRIQNDTGAWPRVDCDVNDISGIATKRDIEELTEPILPKLRRLKPIRYKRKPEPAMRARWEKQVAEGRWAPEAVAQVRRADDELHVGFTAENMAEVFPEIATLNPATGQHDGIRYRLMVTPLVKAVIELADVNTDLLRRLDALERLPIIAMNKPQGHPMQGEPSA